MKEKSTGENNMVAKARSNVYSEQAPQYQLLIIGLTILTLAILFMFVRNLSRGDPSWPILAFVSFLCTWALLALKNMHFELDDEAFTAWFWPFKTRVAYEEMTSVRVEKRVAWWAGLGMHLVGSTVYYTTQYGQYVLVERERGWPRKVAFTPSHPKAFTRRLEERRRAVTNRSGKRKTKKQG